MQPCFLPLPLELLKPLLRYDVASELLLSLCTYFRSFLIQVGVDESNSLNVLLNSTHITGDLGNVNDSISNDYVDITRTEANKITSSFFNGVSVTVTLSTGILNFMAALPHEFMGSTRGLLGNFNQNDTDDLVYPNGTTLSTEAGDRMTHLFGQTCKMMNVC